MSDFWVIINKAHENSGRAPKTIMQISKCFQYVIVYVYNFNISNSNYNNTKTFIMTSGKQN